MSHLCVCIIKTRPQVVPAVLDAEQREMEEMRSLIDNGAFGPPGRAHARLTERRKEWTQHTTEERALSS